MKRILLFLLINQSYCFPIKFICWANSNGYDAPIFDLTNSQTSFIMTKNDVTVNVSANYPFYNNVDYSGFGINSRSQYSNRIDETGQEYLNLKFSKTINLTQMELGGFSYPHYAIITITNLITSTSNYYFLRASGTNFNANSITRFTFNPPVTINTSHRLLLTPASESLFSFNSFTINNFLSNQQSNASNITTSSSITAQSTTSSSTTSSSTTSSSTTTQSTTSSSTTSSSTTAQSTNSNIMITTLQSGGLNLTTTNTIIEEINQTTEKSNRIIIFIIIGIIVGLCCMVGTLIGLIYLYRSIKRNKMKKTTETTETTEIDIEREKGVEKVKKIKVNELEKSDVKIGELIGNGHFGKVYRGKWQDNNIALKTIDCDDKKQLLDELEILSLLNHVNIVRLFGIYKDYIVMEYIGHGNVIQYIQKEQLVDLDILINISKQICSGMIYLQENNIIHRDLAARNILIDHKPNPPDNQNDIIAKISDFGLSRFVLTGQYISSNAIFPIRWTAPETMEKGHFSHQSDVWSFGIVLWEIFSHGQIPYYFMTNTEVIKYVLNGNHLDKPNLCPDSLFSAIVKMWHLNPLNRPSFHNIYTFLKTLNDNAKLVPIAINLSAISSSEDEYSLTPRYIRSR